MLGRILFVASLLGVASVSSVALADVPTVAPPSVEPDTEPSAEPAHSRVTGVIVEIDAIDAEIFLDGKSIGHAPFGGPVVAAPGHHMFTAQLAGRAPVRKEVDVREGETAAIVLRIVPLRADTIGYDAPAAQPIAVTPRVRSSAIILGGGSLAAVALGTAVALNLTANAKANQARALQTSMHQAGGTASSCTAPSSLLAHDCAALQDALTARDTYANLSLGGYVVAGVAAAATIAYIVWPAQQAEKKAWFASVRPAPMFGAGTGGLQLAGSF